YNEEVTRIPRILDGHQLEIDTLANFISDLSIASFRTFICQVTKVFVLPAFSAIEIVLRHFELVGNVEFRKEYVARKAVRFDFVDDFRNIYDGFRQIAEKFLHLIARFEIVFLIRESVAVTTASSYRSGLLLTIADTKQDVVCIGIFLIDVKNIVRSD